MPYQLTVQRNPTVYNVADNGASPNNSASVNTSAIQATFAKLTAAGGGTLYFPGPGTYVTTGSVFQSASKFTLRGDYGAILSIAPNTVSNPNQGSADVITIADCTDFSIENITIDGRRETLFPMTVLAANAIAGQATVQLAHGAGANYVVGQRLNVCGGLTANGGADANLLDNGPGVGNGMIIQTITPGVGAANDTITFTTNLNNAYTAAAGTLSDGYGPYAANGAYVTPWQTGQATVAGRTYNQEDQQNGIHLLNCQRFRIAGCEIHGMWESAIRTGTHNLTGSSQNDGAQYGTITGNVLWHCYDQGVGLWCSTNCTVTSNTITAAGWAGVCLTMSDDCTISGNVCSDNVQRIPNDIADGNGIAIEGGRGNTVTGNKLKNNYAIGIHLTAAGTLPFGSPAQVATTVAAGSNTVALPTGTINVASTTGFAGAGQVTVLSSAGAQQITYTGKSGTTFTGCTGGVGTLYTGQRTVQYPVFLNNGAPLAIASATTIVSDGTKFQVGGHYSIIDGPRTERIDVLSIATNTLTLARPTTFYHQDKCQIGQAVSEGNTLSGNAITYTTASAGIDFASAVRTTVLGNIIDQAGSVGIDLNAWQYGGVQPPCGTVISGNTITAPDYSTNGGTYQAIVAALCSDLQINYNRCGGAPSTQGYYIALYAQALTDSVIAGNTISDAYAIGMRLDFQNEWVCKRLQVSNNEILRCFGEGLIVYGGDALTVTGNIIVNSASNNGPGGFGGALDLRGVKNSQISNNTVVNNGHGGIGLDSGTINGATVFCTNNIIAGNIAYDDGLNYDAFNGAHTQQGSGIKELSAGQGPNIYLNNIVSGNVTNWTITSTGNTLRGNQNYNPAGSVTAPAFPATTVAATNTSNVDVTAYIANGAGAITVVQIAGFAGTYVTTGYQIPANGWGSVRIPATGSVKFTYASGVPTWTWQGE